MSIKYVCRLGVLITPKLSKERSSFKLREEGYFELHKGMIEGSVAFL
jgi:hypothetical protein